MIVNVLHHTLLVAATFKGKPRRLVDGLPRLIDEGPLRADNAAPGAGAREGEEALDRTGREDVVVVEGQEVFPLGAARQEPARPGDPHILVKPDLDFRMVLRL